ncbi:MAG: DUF2341 domain-containing protein [Candidatus Kerfeldbacteria bacterium]
MSKLTKKSIQVLIILCVAVVLAAGLFSLIYFTQHTPQQKHYVIKEVPPDPETVIDKVVQESGRNYIDKRDDEGNLVFNEDGALTRIFYGADIFYQTEDGDYQDIDTTIVTAQGDYDYENTTNVSKTYFKAETQEDDFIKYEVAGERGVTFSFAGVDKSTPEVSSNTITYPDIYEGIDAKYTISGSKILEELIVEEEPIVDRIDQNIKLQDVYYKEQDNGSITFHDNATGHIVFFAIQPIMYELEESTGFKKQIDESESMEVENLTFSYGLHYEITEADNGDIVISKVIDDEGRKWLEQANYPVAIDFTFSAIDSTVALSGESLRHNWSGTNYYMTTPATISRVGNLNTSVARWYYRSFFSFDTGSEWASYGSSDIVGAKFTFYMWKTGTCSNCAVYDYQGDCRWNTHPCWQHRCGLCTNAGGDVGEESASGISANSGADIWDSLPYHPGGNGFSDAYYNVVMTPEGAVDLNGIPTTQAECSANPDDCKREVFVGIDSVSQTGETQIALFDTSGLTVNEGNWKGVRTFNSGSGALDPTLEVVYMPKFDINVVPLDSDEMLTIEWDDNSDNESGWELQRCIDPTPVDPPFECDDSDYFDANHVSFSPIPTGDSSDSCGTDCTYTCTTTEVETVGGCTIDNDGLESDSLYYYRGRIIHVSDLVSGPTSVWSEDDDGSGYNHEWTRATEILSSVLELSSPVWDSLRIYGGGSPTDAYIDSHVNSNPLHTKYALGVRDEDTWRNCFAEDSGGGIYTFQLPITTNPYTVDFAHNMVWWMTDVFGWQMTAAINVESTDDCQIYPNREFKLCEWAQDTRSPDNYLNTPTSYENCSLDTGKAYSRARDPSPPTFINNDPYGGYFPAITVQMDTTPFSLPVTTLNPSDTEYAMSVTNVNTGKTKFFGDTSDLQEWTMGQPVIPDWGTQFLWNNNNPRTVYNLESATCYKFRAISKNGEPTEVGEVGEDESWGFPDSDEFPSEAEGGFTDDLWSVGYPSEEYCTPLSPPDQPTVTCGFNQEKSIIIKPKVLSQLINDDDKSILSIKTANASVKLADANSEGYYCDVSFTDDINTGTIYYKIQRCARSDIGSCADGDFITVSSNSTLKSFIDESVFPGLACDINNEVYEYRVQADNTIVEPSDWSTVAEDILPPCQPTPAPTANNFQKQTMTFNWTAPLFGSPISGFNSGYYTYLLDSPTDLSPVKRFQSVLFLTTYTPLPSLYTNTPYYFEVSGVDDRSREGVRSPQGGPFYTLADNPNFTVECGYDSSDYCTVDITNHGLNDVENHPPDYCLSRKVGSSSSWRYYNYEKSNWGISGPATCDGQTSDYWRSAKTDYTTSWSLTDYNLTCNTLYTYRIEAKNDVGIVTPSPHEESDTTTICPPLNVRHTYNGYLSGYRIRVAWDNPPPTIPPTLPDEIRIYKDATCGGDYEVMPTGSTETDNSTDPNYGTDASLYANIEKPYSVCYYKDGVLGRPGDGDLNAYTSIQTPTGVSFSSVTKDSMVVNYRGTLTRLSGNSLDFYMSYTNGGSGGSNPSWIPGSYNDTGLSTNYQYCYRVRAKNNETGAYTTGDYTNYGPAGDQDDCKYTLASIPKRPVRSQVDSSTVNVIIREGDGNPHGIGLADDTDYAICVTEYNIDGSVYQEGYVQNNNTVNWLPPPEKCGDSDTGVSWDTRAGWGLDSGVDITGVESSKKFGFSVKARNGDDINTNFGPEATLFLVKNNVVGWAWSANIGWVSLNCLNFFKDQDYGFSCDPGEHWGINTSYEPTRTINPVEGYAWSASGQALKETLSISETTQIGVNAGPKGITYDSETPGGPYVWGVVWASDHILFRLNSVDLTFDTFLIGTAGDDLRDIVLANGYLWITANTTGKLYKVDPANPSGGAVDTLDFETSAFISGCASEDCHPFHIAYDGTDLWISNDVANNEGLIFRVNTNDGLERNCDGTEFSGNNNDRCNLGTTYSGWPFVLNNDVWVVNKLPLGVSKISIADGSISSYPLTTSNPYAIDYDGQYLWITHNNNPGIVTILNPNDGSEVNSFVVGSQLRGIIPFNNSMWVASLGDDTVIQLDPYTQSVVDTYNVGDEPWELTTDNDANIWITNHGLSKNVSKINLSDESVKVGLGWISLNKAVCSNDSQQGCTDDDECGVVTDLCVDTPAEEVSEDIIVAGDPPSGDVAYGFCYDNDAPSSGEKYGECSKTTGQSCTESDLANCLDIEEYCIYYTCQTGDICIDPVSPPSPAGWVKECRDTATANFNGETREIEGWARILSSKKQGEQYTPPFDDWGWIKLGGQYDDGEGNTGDYNLAGTEIDSQLFLGDPDVSGDSLSLYTIFGWGWNADISDYTATSDWLPSINISNNFAARRGLERVHNSAMILDSNGDPHIAWEVFDTVHLYYDIYYLKLVAGKWFTISGVEYQPGAMDPFGSMLSVGYGSGLYDDGRHIRFPSLALGADDYPHLAGAYEESVWRGSQNEGGDIIYTKWNGSQWTSSDGVTSGYDVVGGEASDDDHAQVPILKLNDSDVPNIVYRVGISGYGDIYFKVWDGRIWNTIDGTSDSLNVSNITNSSSVTPKLIMDGNTPHIVYIDSGLAKYRWWDGTNWVSAGLDEPFDTYVCSNNFLTSCTEATEQADCGWYCHDNSVNAGNLCSVDIDCGTDYWAQCLHNRCESEDVAVNWGLKTCNGFVDGTKCYDDDDCPVSLDCQKLSNIEWNVYGTEAASFDLYDESTPGVVFRGSTGIYYLRWDSTIDNGDGTFGAWVSVSGGDLESSDLVISNAGGRAGRVPSVIIGDDNYPRIIWGEEISNLSDITYKQWDGSQWQTIDGIASPLPPAPPNVANQSAYISETPAVQSYSPSVQLDRFGNPHALWSEINYSGYSCGEFGNGGVIDGIDGDIHDIEIDYDNNAIYLAGVSDDGGVPHWRIDKRRFDTGALIAAFDTDGFINGDADTLSAWNIELDKDNNNFYIVGRESVGDDWRLERRNMDTGSIDWPDNPSGVVRMGYGNATDGIDLKIDSENIYITGVDDSDNWRIEKRSKNNGNLVTNFGTDGFIISTDGNNAKKILIDDTYMWVVGQDDNLHWRIEKRLLSNGDLVTTFGNAGIFTGSSTNPDSGNIYDVTIDGDNIYIVGKTTDNNWLTAKLDINSGILDEDFGVDGYVETSYASAVNFIYGIEVSGDDIIIAGSLGDGLDNDWHYEIRNKNTGIINEIVVNNGWQNGLIDSVNGSLVWGMDGDDDYMYIFGNDDSGNWRIERRWKSTGTLDNHYNTNAFSDCKDPEYPMCIYTSPSFECLGGDIFYSRWTPGNVQGGIGWVEFMPAGALLGVPWVQTAFADIFGTEGVSLSPPPRGSGEYTATYLILSNGSIEGIPTYYYGDSSRQPSTQFYEGGLNPLIEGSSLPFGEDALSKINVDALVSGPDFNRYGHPLTTVTQSGIDISDSSQLGDSPLLNGGVYHYIGNASIDDEMTFIIGDSDPTPATDPETTGNGLIVIDGDLEINANTYYEAGVLADITEMPSVGLIVRGNIYISPFVTELAGVFVALDNPDTADISEGIISTSRKSPLITETADNDDAYVSVIGSDYDNTNQTVPDNESLKFGKEVADIGNYQFRLKATLNTNLLGVTSTEPNIPIMVRVGDVGTAPFDDFWLNNSDDINGYDINFADADGTPLDFHIEKFENNQEIIVWVQVPQLDINSLNDYIWMYYGSVSPVSQQDENGTYNSEYVGTWHLNETSGDRHNSTSTISIDGVPSASLANEPGGIAAGADKFDGTGGTLDNGYCFEGLNTGGVNNLCRYDIDCEDPAGTLCTDVQGGSNPGGCMVPDPTGSYLEMPINILSGAGNFTIEAWVRTSTTDNLVTIIEQRDENNAGDGSYQLRIYNGIELHFYYWQYFPGISFSISANDSNLNNGSWHHVAVTINNTNDEAILYIDGVAEATRIDMTDIIDIDAENSTYVGADISNTGGHGWPCYKVDSYFNGDIDEIRISNTVRSAEYIQATYLAENGSSSFITWGTQEEVENQTDRTFLRFPFGPGTINDILPNSEIRNAYLNLTDDGNSSNGPFDAKIYLIDYGDVVEFTVANWPAQDLYNVNVSNGMTYSIDTNTWDSTIDSENMSVDIKSLIQRYVNSDEYGQSYADGDITYLGLVINEGDADVGDFRSFYSQEDTTGHAPELIVEHSPRRTYLTIDPSNVNDDVHAWGSAAGEYSLNSSCLYVGSYSNNPNRIFYRFIPDTAYTILPDNSEIIEAHLRLNNTGCATGTEPFQIRQGLLNKNVAGTTFNDMPTISSNPYNFGLTQDVFEVSQELLENEFNNSNIVLDDISNLVQSWIDDTIVNYDFGNDIGLRLRRGNKSSEIINGAGEYRAVSEDASILEVDYLVPLQVSGLFVARGYNFDRKYTKDLAPSERIVYDGRVVANTPPGLADFSKALPIYQRVAP